MAAPLKAFEGQNERDKKMALKDTFVYESDFMHVYVFERHIDENFPWRSSLYEWKAGQRPCCVFKANIASKKQSKSYFYFKNKQTHLASARIWSLQEMKMPAWHCHHIESKPTPDLVIPPQLLYL